ncbi:MAG: PBP1A family penicillin-binding protein [Deltaproteobacteria bacterium]|nr:PBP1A family penicillin-binding protein [Deltaproteobacteria bacterium]
MNRRKSPKNKRKTQRLTLRKPKLPQGRREWAFAILKWGAIGGLALAAIGAATLALLFWIYGSDPALPKISSLNDYDPLEVSTVQADDGTVIGEVFEERRTFVPFDDIPELVVQAFVSAEDSKFFEHEGIDYLGMFRAVIVNLKSGKKKQGASTITQQVVKTFLLTPERTFKRKFQEIVLARRLESKLSKQEILSLYLNQIYFGHGRYGVEQASQFYFGKSVRDVNPGEAAMLAGLPQAPENISPKKKKNQERAKFRQKYVLEQMLHNGYITEDVAQRYIDEPIQVVGDPYPNLGAAPEWVQVAKDELQKSFGEEESDRAGVAVTMTVDLEIQGHAASALRKGLRDIDKRQGYGHPIKTIRKNKIDLEVAKLSRRLGKKGPRLGKTYRAIVRKVDDDGELVVDLGKWKASVLLDKPGKGDRYNPEGKKPGERFKVGSMIRVRLGTYDGERKPKHTDRQVRLATGPEGAVVVMNPKNREVLALVGGYDTKIAGFNRATQAKRQPGSTFKPLVYAAAIDSGDFTAASIVNDAPEVYDLWKPQNYKKGKFEGPVRLRHALAKSINTVAIRVMSDIGPERVAELARAMGIESDLPEELSLALGSGEVTPLELANAFATLAAGGRFQSPVLVKRVGEEPRKPEAARQVLRPEVAYVVVDMMRSVVTEGTGGRARKLGITVAGKTGTSNSARDAWFIALTPELAVAVWVGFDEPRPLGRREGGGTSAAPVFVELGKRLKLRDKKFRRPPGLVDKRIDRETGLLAAAGAPKDSAYTEVFVAGTEPTEIAPLPGQVDAADFVVDQYDQYGDYGDGDDEPAPSP